MLTEKLTQPTACDIIPTVLSEEFIGNTGVEENSGGCETLQIATGEEHMDYDGESDLTNSPQSVGTRHLQHSPSTAPTTPCQSEDSSGTPPSWWSKRKWEGDDDNVRPTMRPRYQGYGIVVQTEREKRRHRDKAKLRKERRSQRKLALVYRTDGSPSWLGGEPNIPHEATSLHVLSHLVPSAIPATGVIGDATMHAPLNASNPTCEMEDTPENRKLGSVHHGVALPLCPVATSGDVAKAMHPTMTSPLALNSASDNRSDGITAGQTHLAPIAFGVQNVGNPDQGRRGTGGTINMVVESNVGDQREEVIICAAVAPDCVATIMVDVENAGRPEQAITAGGIRQAEQKVDMVEADPAGSQMATPETTDSVSKQTPEEAEVVVPAKPSLDDLLDLQIAVGAISSPVFDARAGPACFGITVDGLVNLLRRQLDKKEDIIHKQANEIAELVKNGREQADEIAHLEEYLELLIESAYDEDGYPLSKSEKREGKRKARTEGGTEDTQDGSFDGIRSSFENLADENINPVW
jgi:hypothetical protein